MTTLSEIAKGTLVVVVIIYGLTWLGWFGQSIYTRLRWTGGQIRDAILFVFMLALIIFVFGVVVPNSAGP